MGSKIARKIQRNRAHVNQIEQLIAYMEDHSEFAKGHITNLGASGKSKYKQMWTDLANDLNKTGPVAKSATAWGKTWRVMKNAAKKKKAQHTIQMNMTGNVGVVYL